MRNYLAAECYKTFRRKYFYIILAVCLGLEAVLLWGYWTTWKWGNSNVDFYSTAIMVPFMLSLQSSGRENYDCDRRYRILRAI